MVLAFLATKKNEWFVTAVFLGRALAYREIV